MLWDHRGLLHEHLRMLSLEADVGLMAIPNRRKRIHPADVIDERAVREASSFIASIFVGLGQYDKREAHTLVEARTAAAELLKAHPSGRKVLIYAIHADGRQFL